MMDSTAATLAQSLNIWLSGNPTVQCGTHETFNLFQKDKSYKRICSPNKFVFSYRHVFERESLLLKLAINLCGF